MDVEIISVGDELLTGMVLNRNASFIAEKLSGIGFRVRWITTVSDNEKDLEMAFKQAAQRAPVVIATGGLGPTPDDNTRKVIARFLNSKLVFHPQIFEKIEKRFLNRGRTMPETNRYQACLPGNTELIENSAGSAPGLFFEKNDIQFFVLPGVPVEMQQMLEKNILPRLRNFSPPSIFKFITLKTFGLPESEVHEKIKDFQKKYHNIDLAYLPRKTGVHLRLSVTAPATDKADRLLDQGKKWIYSRLEATIYGEGDETLEERVAGILIEKGLTIAAAESCTGGLVSHKLTNVPGSSAYFLESVVAYSNSAKVNRLGVPESIIQTHGAVSPETGQAMAKGVRRISGADIGIATTGIAGPGGGTLEKPAGLVYIAYNDNKHTLTEKHLFGRDRAWNKERSALTALDLVRKILLGYL